MGQIFTGRAKAKGLNASFSSIMAAVSAEIVLSDFRIITAFIQFFFDCLNKFSILVKEPAREETFTFDSFSGVTFFLTYSIGDFYLKFRIICHQFIHKGNNRSQYTFFGFADKQTTVIGCAAIFRNNRGARIRSRFHVNQFQDTLPENGMFWRNNRTNGFGCHSIFDTITRLSP